MFSKELELSISQAYQDARENRHEFLTVEHMLLALLDNASALAILNACGADCAVLRKEIRKVLEDTVSLIKEGDTRDTQPTIGFQRVLQRALYQSLGNYVHAGHRGFCIHGLERYRAFHQYPSGGSRRDRRGCRFRHLLLMVPISLIQLQLSLVFHRQAGK